MSQDRPDIFGLLTRIAVAWLNNPRHQLAVDEVPILIERIHEGLAGVQAGVRRASDNPQGTASGHTPAVTAQRRLADQQLKGAVRAAKKNPEIALGVVGLVAPKLVRKIAPTVVRRPTGGIT